MQSLAWLVARDTETAVQSFPELINERSDFSTEISEEAVGIRRPHRNVNVACDFFDEGATVETVVQNESCFPMPAVEVILFTQ